MGADELPLGAMVGNYKVDAVVGRGGMSTVYRGHHRLLGIARALKVATRRAWLESRIPMEGRILARFRHACIVQLADLIDVRGQPILVLEYLDGPSLADLIDRRQLSLADADRVALQVGSALAYVHGSGVVHRDVKPHNVVMHWAAGRLRATLVDFGLAADLCQVADGAYRQGGLIGTPTYMAPEQVGGRQSLSPRCDVWSFGCLLYEMLAGRPPFRARQRDDLLCLIRTGEVEPISRWADVPRRMSRCVEACLQRDPARRPGSVGDALRLWRGPAASPLRSPAPGPEKPVQRPWGASYTDVSPPRARE